ncbi:uncharacterized protein AC631_04492 [Debaryomyces fabryi]|uniref:Uncharacterized protein n=1 Tax=Debaryomyces fabryi TaxID=58627 RepID=A0A0V1PUB0_9ASCO|nr:uncharacterized protein AC631_04492 [Debaryomyces fabryi]KRZ99762.1 hypothetical protein AC631_04492 [Debaryomyces fabryi]CUM56673.1 unnamed protein product [Debaryomyces fabryi]
MDAVSHHNKAHSMTPGVLSETISSTTVLPPTSIRDITALIFILLALPQSVSCIILTTYILSGSTKFLGGRLIVKHLLRRNRYHDDFYNERSDNYEFSRKNLNYKSKLIGSALQAFSINAIILLTIHYFFPKRWLQYLSIFAKSIIASELIGSSTTNSTTITSITSTTTTNTTTTTTINNKKINPNNRITSESKYFNNHIWNAVVCFITVLYISYIMQNWLLLIDMNQVQYLFSNLAYDMRLFIKHPILIFNPNTHTNLLSQLFHAVSPFLLTSRIFSGSKHTSKNNINVQYFLNGGHYIDPSLSHNWSYNIIMRILKSNFKLNDTSLIIVSKSLTTFSMIINYVNLVLCIHVIILTISPILKKTFLLKRYSKTLDHLSNLTPNVPIDFKRNYLSKNMLSSNPAANLSVVSLNEASSTSDTLPIVVNVEEPKNDMLEVEISHSISNSSPCAKDESLSKSNFSSAAAENFQTFCITPFTNKLPNSNYTLKSHKLVNLTDHSTSKPNKQIQAHALSQNQTQHPTPNSTTIIDKNLINVTSTQPFWAVLAACKAMFKKPSLFAGDTTRCKNNGGKFITSTNRSFETMLSTIFIDDTRVVFKVLEVEIFELIVPDLTRLSVKVNGIRWAHMDIYEGLIENEKALFICVYGLNPLFQYEIDLYEQNKEGNLLAHFIINTVSSSTKAILNKSPEITSLMTLQSSLMSTIENLNQFKTRFKRLKKEENKKISDAKKDIDNLKSKISKYSHKQSNDGRISGKLKGLQHSVIQLENEIKDLKNELQRSDSLRQESESNFKVEETKLLDEIDQLNQFINEYESSMNEYRSKLKSIGYEKQQFLTKKNKLVSKKEARNEELQKISNDIKYLKKSGIIGKLHRRNKKVQEKYDFILPKVINATADLQKEFEEFLLSGNNVSGDEMISNCE